MNILKKKKLIKLININKKYFNKNILIIKNKNKLLSNNKNYPKINYLKYNFLKYKNLYLKNKYILYFLKNKKYKLIKGRLIFNKKKDYFISINGFIFSINHFYFSKIKYIPLSKKRFFLGLLSLKQLKFKILKNNIKNNKKVQLSISRKHFINQL